MRPLLAASLALGLIIALSPAAWADSFPKSPKAGPPQPLPEPLCDVSAPSSGEWLAGKWVAPRTRWTFAGQGSDMTWTMERKGAINEGFGWRDGATISGNVETLSGCTVTLTAGEGAFRFDGVLTEAGHLFGYAVNPKGETVRFTLRRER